MNYFLQTYVYSLNLKSTLMNRAIMLMAGIALLLSSCSISKEVRAQRNLLSGTWTLTDITYENNQGSFDATLFGDANAICFEDSQWFFRDNNSTGRYTLKQGSLCQGGDRFFRWSIQAPEANYKSRFQFKFIDEKLKDITGQGYSLLIESLSESEMKMASNVQVDGEPIRIIYHYTKNQ